MKKPNNPQAFPFQVQVVAQYGNRVRKEFVEFDGGMALLDYFAGQALSTFTERNDSDHVTAEWCYDMAESMLKEREKREI